MGEITVLPGYNYETSESVLKELRNILEFIKSNRNKAALEACIDGMSERAPFVASGRDSVAARTAKPCSVSRSA